MYPKDADGNASSVGPDLTDCFFLSILIWACDAPLGIKSADIRVSIHLHTYSSMKAQICLRF